MTPPRPDLQKLPPIARAQAMHRPYRPGRSPMVYGLLITVAINLGWGAWALFGSSGRVLPDWARPQEILIPATLLPAPTAPPPPRVGTAPVAAPSSTAIPVDAKTELVDKTDVAAESAEPSDATNATGTDEADGPAETAPLVEAAP